jgi:tetratricopeptide (TPR) repeat protein
MHTKRRAALIETLAQNVEQVGPEFERFAGIVMGALSKVRLTHAGVNLRGYPVAGVVDSESDDGREAVEYSDRRNYFDGMMTKAEDDLRKILKDRPGAKQIYLVAGERTRPQKVADFKERVLAWPQMAGKALTFFGSEEIATEIVDHLLLDEQLIGRVAPYLADLRRIVDEEAAAALVPSLPSEILARPNVDCEIVARLAVQPVLTIAGMGGLGKSIAAMAYANAHRGAYQIQIWLDGEEVKRAESLRAFPLVRADDPRNIAGLLEAGGCLLVIDDACQDLSIETLTKFCGEGSHVVLTRRLAPQGAYEPPLLTQDEARAMLDAPGAPCPPAVFETVWASINGYPLCLNLLRAAARSGVPWDDLAEDCCAVGKILDEDGVRLVDRLLDRLKDLLQQELSVFVWADLPAVDKAFITHNVAPVGVRNLSAYGLTSVDRGGVVRLHDVVFAALKSLDWCGAARSAELDRALQAFIMKVADEPGLRLWTLVRSMMPKLEAMALSGVDDGPCLYALLAVWEADEVRRDLVGDPLAAASRFAEGLRGPLAVITIIETVEKLFLLDKHDGERVARERLGERMPVFAALASLPALTSREQAQIQHHEGKALKRLGKLDEAAERFEAVLAGPCPMDEARLQLVTIYRSKPEKAAETIALVDQVFARWGAGEDVTYSVILGLIERLPAGEGRWRNDIIARHAEAIKTTIIEAANQGVGQGVRAFAPLGRFISTEMPELFIEIFQQIPVPVPEGSGVDGDKFAWAEIHAEAAKALKADATALRAKALRFYEAMVKPDDFNTQRRAEVLIEMGRAQEAEALLLPLQGRRSPEWVERLLARTRLALGDPAGALERINTALILLKAEHFRSEFLELRFDIRSALGDAEAASDLKAALEASQKAAESKRLAFRLQAHGGDQVQ